MILCLCGLSKYINDGSFFWKCGYDVCVCSTEWVISIDIAKCSSSLAPKTKNSRKNTKNYDVDEIFLVKPVIDAFNFFFFACC